MREGTISALDRKLVREPARSKGKSMATTPNILHLSFHDAGRHLGCYGVKTVHTPHLDALAATGLLFENMFACAAVCSPSRGACLSGRYPSSNGLIHLCHGNFGYRYHAGEKHLSHLLKERGYATALHGFQHEVSHSEVHVRLAFDEVEHAAPAPPIYPVPPADIIAGGAAAYLKERARARQPFYLQVGFFESHRPYDFGGCEPDDSRGVTVPPYLLDNAAARADHAALQGALRKADAGVGLVLEALREAGLEEETLVIFTPDHGLANPRAKATLYDPGLEIACLMRWPGGGLEKGRRIGRLVSNVDLVPTIFDLCAWEKPANLQGRSFADACGMYQGDALRREVYALHHDGDVRAVRTEHYKLIRNFSRRVGYQVPLDITSGAWPILQQSRGEAGVGAVELYDLQVDPLEAHNLAAEPGVEHVREDLEDRLWRWMEACEDPILEGAYTTPRHREQLHAYREWKVARA